MFCCCGGGGGDWSFLGGKHPLDLIALELEIGEAAQKDRLLPMLLCRCCTVGPGEPPQ